MCNTRALRRGDRLFLELKKHTKAGHPLGARPKKEAWQSEREKHEKKRKKDAEAGPPGQTRHSKHAKSPRRQTAAGTVYV